jgi:hypothetical protein
MEGGRVAYNEWLVTFSPASCCSFKIGVNTPCADLSEQIFIVRWCSANTVVNTTNIKNSSVPYHRGLPSDSKWI